MKSRAPRCNEARSETELPACQDDQSWPKPSAASAAAAGAASPLWAITAGASAASSAPRKSSGVRMVRQPLWHGLHPFRARIEGHEDEVQEVPDGGQAPDPHELRLRRIESCIHETQE